MSGEADSVLQQGLNLSSEERYEVAQRLLDSVDGDDGLPDDPAFWEEIARRSDEAHDHPERLLDGPTVLKGIEEHLRRKHGQ